LIDPLLIELEALPFAPIYKCLVAAGIVEDLGGDIFGN